MSFSVCRRFSKQKYSIMHSYQYQMCRLVIVRIWFNVKVNIIHFDKYQIIQEFDETGGHV